MYRIAVLLSGSGTTLQSVIDAIASGNLPVKIEMVISNKSDAYGLVRAQKAGIATKVINVKGVDVKLYSEEIYQLCESKVDLLVMAGFLKKYLPPKRDLPTINTHPSLLPAFGGKGMYGQHVHQAVYDHGVKLTGCTVHFVTEEYDTGPIIAQVSVPVDFEDTPASIQEKVMAAEKKQLVHVIQRFATQKLLIEGRRVILR